MISRYAGMLVAGVVVVGVACGGEREREEAATTSGGKVEVGKATRLEGGGLVHRVRSEFQSGETKVSVLLPDGVGGGNRRQAVGFRTLYVLPVEAGDATRWGNALAEVRKHDLANRYQLVCVFPTFSHLPWYADHPTDPLIRQERYLLKGVVPWIDRNYPVRREAAGRWLVGFSKSGWGAYSLLLRNPNVFGKAAAWDAPLREESPKRFGMGPIFGTGANFEKYRIGGLLARQAARLGGSTRLMLTGYGNFREHHQATHREMERLAIPHVYRDGPKRPHHWESGWLPEAVELLATGR